MHDLRDAFRALKATPVVSSVAILSLALGIGANTAIFSILDARKFTGGRNPVGMRVRQVGYASRPSVDRQIVGYVKDAVYRSLREPILPTMYIPYTQHPEPPSSMSVSVRAAVGSPVLLTRPLAAALTQVHADLAITFRPLSDQVNAALVQERIVAWLSGFFGALALLLAGLGLATIGAMAGWLPARRASRIDPARVLREG